MVESSDEDSEVESFEELQEESSDGMLKSSNSIMSYYNHTQWSWFWSSLMYVWNVSSTYVFCSGNIIMHFSCAVNEIKIITMPH